MPLSFPTSPTNGQTYNSGSSALYQYDGTKWNVILPPTLTVGLPTMPNWTTVGTIQSVGISATTTAPTVPTNATTNAILYKQLGTKTYKVRGVLINATSPTGGANGSGDYLFTLPANLQFDTSIPGQATYTANPAGSDPQFGPRSIIGSISVLNAGSTYSQGFLAGVIPWSTTQYRVYGGVSGNSNYNWQSGFFAITSNGLIAEWEFEFQAV